jgi:pimeloyl-ACP methyl ester carboxylesterase
MDELLDNVMLYWVTGSATSSARLYWESFGKDDYKLPVSTPTGVTVFPKEFVPPVREWMAPRFSNIVYWNEAPRGGHFSAFEQPAIFVAEVRNFFRNRDFHHG